MTDRSGRYSPLGLAALALEHARLLVLVPLAALVLSVGFTVVMRGDYAASASFTPQSKESEAARLSGLASQFGFSMGALGSDGESVDFYARLAKSRALLEQVAQQQYAFARRAGSSDSIKGTLIEILEIGGETKSERLLAAVDALDAMIVVGLDLDANVVTLTTRAPWPGLSEQVNRHLLNEINRFNLERRQSHAAAERRFVEQQITRAQGDLDKAEQELSSFLQHNRRYEEWPQLRFEAGKLQRRVEVRQQVYTTLAQRLEQARIDEVRNTPVITIIDAPEGSAQREASLVKNGIVSMILGVGLVIGLLFMREYRDKLRADNPEEYARVAARSRTLLQRRRRTDAGSLLLPLLLTGAALSLSACSESLTEPGAPPVFARITTGGQHSCALTNEGQAYCWGRGADGELGNGAYASTRTPVRVSTDLVLREIAAGEVHTCALAEGGQAYCWGWNVYNQRGNAFDAAEAIPVPVRSTRTFTALSAGLHHTCALAATGEIFCWGYNRFGQLGDGTTNTSTEPVAVAGSRRFKAVSAGGWHTCAIGTDDRAYCWGRNDQSQLAIGSDTLQVAFPTPVTGVIRFNAISAGYNHTCALSGRQAYCWGGNERGQLGDGTVSRPGLSGSVIPIAAGGGAAFDGLSAGAGVTCGVTTGQRASCWGRGDLGQLGTGEDADHYLPQYVELHAEGALVFRSIAAAGSTHACGVSTGNALYCWGTGGEGQLGHPSILSTLVPQRVRAADENIR